MIVQNRNEWGDYAAKAKEDEQDDKSWRMRIIERVESF